MINKFIFLFFLMVTSLWGQTKIEFAYGADVLLTEHLSMLEGKHLGIITNHTALLSDGKHLLDALNEHRDQFTITALFGPEHGIRGEAPAGQSVENLFDSLTHAPIFSLYGKNKKPTAEMLKNVDLLIFDMQDVGARFYTYLSTLYYSLQSAAENNIPILVLDRPNPIGGVYADGPIRQNELTSFVGIAPIPIAHGMTFGELATYFSNEGLLGDNLHPKVTILKMKNWKRSAFFDELDTKWIKPSPNISSVETEIIYPGTCLLEGTNISEGRGTDNPFLTIGAPFINAKQLVEVLNKAHCSGLAFEVKKFIPREIPRTAVHPKYEDVECHGITIHITERTQVRAVQFGITLVSTLHKLYPKEFSFKEKSFDLLSGDSMVRKHILENTPPQTIIASYQKDVSKFLITRQKYLLY